jgi:hypothetical protein
MDAPLSWGLLVIRQIQVFESPALTAGAPWTFLRLRLAAGR